MARGDSAVRLRVPANVHDRLKAEAAANKRSMNAEVVARLEASLNGVQTMNEDVVGTIERRVIAAVEARLPRLIAERLMGHA